MFCFQVLADGVGSDLERNQDGEEVLDDNGPRESEGLDDVNMATVDVASDDAVEKPKKRKKGSKKGQLREQIRVQNMPETTPLLGPPQTVKPTKEKRKASMEHE